MKIDAYAHMVPWSYIDFVERNGGSTWVRTWSRHPALSQSAASRIGLLDEFEVDVQIVTPPVPPVDHICEAITDDASDLAVRLNDGIAEWTAHDPDRLLGVGAVSLKDPQRAMDEMRRAAVDLGLVGIQVPCGCSFRPLDSPEVEEIFALAEELDLTVWIHPWRDPRGGDYSEEDVSRRQASYLIGWPYETAVAVFRMASSGMLGRHLRLKCVLHHAGGMTAPLWQRLETFYSKEWSNVTGHEFDDDGSFLESLRRFYVDTATSGSSTWLLAAVEFFGLERVLFGTDAPFGTDNGRDAFARAIRAVDGLPLDEAATKPIWGKNAQTLFPRHRVGFG